MNESSLNTHGHCMHRLHDHEHVFEKVSALVTGLHRPKENHAKKKTPLILWSNDATKKEWRQNLCKTYVEKHINNSAEVWPFHCGYYCDIRLFVWYCLCVKLNRRARTGDHHKKDIENALKNPWLIVTWPVTVQGLIVNYR